MAHFAELDENNIVLRVVVINNDDILDENGEESETVGRSFCERLFDGGRWVQTSYNNSFRKQYAGVGGRYDAGHDIFIAPQPAPWYVLNDNFDWVIPLGVKPHNGETVTDSEWLWLEKVFASDSPTILRSLVLG